MAFILFAGCGLLAVMMSSPGAIRDGLLHIVGIGLIAAIAQIVLCFQFLRSRDVPMYVRDALVLCVFTSVIWFLYTVVLLANI